MSDVDELQSRRAHLARVAANLNAGIATILATPRGDDEPRNLLLSGAGNPMIPGVSGDGFATPFFGGVNR